MNHRLDPQTTHSNSQTSLSQAFLEKIQTKSAGLRPALCFLMISALPGTPRLLAQDATTEAAAPAPQSLLDEERLRSALTKAVIALRRIADKDENRFFQPTLNTKKAIGTREVEVKYAEKEVDVPIVEQYKTMEAVTSSASDNTSTKLREVNKVRIIGYKKEKKLVRDSAGTILRKEKHAVYGPGGRDHLVAGFWGQNALALYAMVKCGVPTTDSQFVRSSSRLMKYAAVYGLPDRTWDLAWLTAAAVNLPRTLENKKLTERLVNKLLLGQITDGAATGLWGPVCVNTDLFSAMLTYEMTTSQKEVAPAEEAHNKEPENYRLQKKLSEIQDKIKQVQAQYPEVTTFGLIFDRVVGGVKQAPNTTAFYESEDGKFEEITTIGWPHYLIKERTADLQCTALVLFALKEAARNNWLPTSTTVPKLPTGQSVLPPESSNVIILRALTALGKLQNDKPLSEGNFWMPTHSFDKLGLADLPVDDKKFAPVASPVTPMSTAQTYAALENAALLSGQQAAAQLTSMLNQTRDAAVKVAENMPAVDAKPLPDDTVTTPCDLIYALQPALARAGNTPEAQAARVKLTDLLLTLQLKDGTWVPRPKYPWRHKGVNGGEWEDYETSMIARINVYGPRNPSTPTPLRPGEVEIPFNAETRSWRDKPFYLRNVALAIKPDVTATSYAILSLAWMWATSNPAGSPPPVFLDWAEIEKIQLPGPQVEEPAAAAPAAAEPPK